MYTCKRCVFLSVLLLIQGGCGSLSFYQQAIFGQLEVLNARIPVEKMLTDPETNTALRKQLQLARQIILFAEGEIGLPVMDRYRSYVALDRPYVVWNVFAAPTHSLKAYMWCYPIVGCAPYRGYFDQAHARAYAQKLRQNGLETYVTGVAAYSTLGWFDDPLLSTFLHWPEPDLAGLLLHELAHGVVWIEGDTSFNESFASFVAEEGMRQYFGSSSDQLKTWQSQRDGWNQMKTHLLQLKSALERAYLSDDPAHEKSIVFASFQQRYLRDRAALGDGRYDRLINEELNNAYLVSLGVYEDLVPAFKCLFGKQGDWQVFFTEVKDLIALEVDDRDERLQSCKADQPNNI